MRPATKQDNKTHFQKDIEKLAAKGAPEAVLATRLAGAAAFSALDYPSNRLETWRHTNVAPLLNVPWTSLIEPPADELAEATLRPYMPPIDMPIRVVFVDGFYRHDLSRATALPARAHVGSISDKMNREADAMLRQLLHETPAPNHVFSALNHALLQDGPFIYIPDNCIVDAPIHVLHVAGQRPPRTAAHLRAIIALGDNAQAEVVLHHVAMAGDAPYFNNLVEDVRLGANASLKRTEIIAERSQGYHMSTGVATLYRDSRLYCCTFVLNGGAITRKEMTASMAGPNADVQLHGLYLNRGSGLVDNDLHIAHLAPHCVSRMLYKGVLDGNSRSVFRGMVYVDKHAQKTDSRQLTANLALSRQARVDAKPQLEIYADDVKCTHGATVGGPPDEQLYYLRSRGVDADRARAMLTQGFASEVALRTPDPATRKYLTDYLYDTFHPDT